MSQNDRVLAMLRRGWVCGTEFLDERMPRYGARIYELRRRGFLIASRPCADPQHRHASRQEQWRIIAEPSQGGQLTAVLEGVGV
jgi:hypothetical protein